MMVNTMNRIFQNLSVWVFIFVVLGCGEDAESKAADTEDSDLIVNIDENCDMGCISMGACLGDNGEINYSITCPAQSDICCNREAGGPNPTLDTSQEDCSYTCVEFNSCEMTNMHMEMSCDLGVCCDTRDNNPGGDADDADPCRYNCVPYAYCERHQIHPEQRCATAGQICCDGDVVYIPDSDSASDSTTASAQDDTETASGQGDTSLVNIETDGTDDDSAGTDTHADGTGSVDSETIDTVGDTVTDAESDSMTDSETETFGDTATEDSDSTSDSLLDCAYFCVAAEQCVVSNYHPEMYCATSGTACCDI